MSQRELAAGEEVQIIKGIFAGRQGVIEQVLPSGKLRVRVKTLRTMANARLEPSSVRPIRVPNNEEESSRG